MDKKNKQKIESIHKMFFESLLKRKVKSFNLEMRWQSIINLCTTVIKSSFCALSFYLRALLKKSGPYDSISGPHALLFYCCSEMYVFIFIDSSRRSIRFFSRLVGTRSLNVRDDGRIGMFSFTSD